MKATGERWERRQWREERPERVAAVGERRSRIVGKESTGHRNRNRSSGGRFRSYCDPQRNSEDPSNPRGRPLIYNIDTNRQVLYWDT
mgnify:CR=1 FL=1